MKRLHIIIGIILFLTVFISANSPPISIRPFEELILKQNVSLTINLTEYYEDPDGDNLTYDITPATGITINLTYEELRIIPDDGFSGPTNMSITVDDSNVSKTDTVLIYVLEANPSQEDESSNETNSTGENETEESIIPNTPPSVTLNQESTVLTKVGEEFILSVNSSDEDGDFLTYTWYVDGSLVLGDEEKRDFSDLEVGVYVITLETDDGKDIITSTWNLTVEEKINKTLRWTIITLTLIGLGAIDYYLISLLKKEKHRKVTETDDL